MQTAKTLIRLGGCHFVGFVMRQLNEVYSKTLQNLDTQTNAVNILKKMKNKA